MKNMIIRFQIVLFALFIVCSAFGQTTQAEIATQYEKAYKKRITKEYLNRVYIPKDLADAFNQLNGLIDDDSKKKFTEVDEMEAARKLHFSLGRWIIHNWGFYEGSRFSHYLKGIGLTYPDDMARFVILTYHRNLKKSKLDVKSLLEAMLKDREEEHQARLKQGEVLFEEKRMVPKPDSLKNN